MWDVEAIRREFPILERPVAGQRLVYLDSAATSQKPRGVLEAIRRHFEQSNANVHRGVHRLSEESTEAYEEARRAVARFLGAAGPESLVFVRNATEAINLVAHAYGDRHLAPGDEVLVSEMEHHSNLVPWFLLARRTGARVRAVPVSDEGLLDLGAIQGALGEGRVRLVALAAVSNVLGTRNPLSDIARWAHDAGAVLLVDAAQAVPHLPVRFRDSGADFLAFSGHKALGPMGIGGLLVRPELYDRMDPFLGGGEMIREVTLEGATWADPPHRFEAGTPDVAGAVGLRAAVEYLESLGMEAVADHALRLGTYARQRLREIPGIRLLGPEPGPVATGSVVTFDLEGIHPHDIAQGLDRRGIAVRAGHHCCQPLHRRLGLPATTRASFHVFNGEDDVDALVEALGEVRREMTAPVVGASLGDRDSEPADALFREVVMDHYLHPAGREPLEDATVEWEGQNPLCGDHVHLRMRLEGDRIAAIQVLGEGCSISVASGSMMADHLKGRTLEEARRLLAAVRAMFRGEPLPGNLDLGDVKVLEGVRELPVRVKCALLAWTTAEEGLRRVPAESDDGGREVSDGHA
ncbi:SUF system NifU family Fe-S cluster assembly protein [Myxococcota bacterium]|nr:SUF system NifU family Fe-S cluster assembly protein [Myxococcota bacterium]